MIQYKQQGQAAPFPGRNESEYTDEQIKSHNEFVKNLENEVSSIEEKTKEQIKYHN